MRIPRRVPVNGRQYDVRRVAQTSMPADPGEILYGYCDPEKTLILIAKSLSPEAARGTYEHEVGHAASEESGARAIMEEFTDRAEELEEKLCRVWLPVLLDSLKPRRRK